MRTKAEILESFHKQTEVIVDLMSFDRIETLHRLEVLLDIRDVLVEIEDRLDDIVVKSEEAPL